MRDETDHAKTKIKQRDKPVTMGERAVVFVGFVVAALVVLVVDHYYFQSGVTDIISPRRVFGYGDDSTQFLLEVYAGAAKRDAADAINTKRYSKFRFEQYKSGKERSIIVSCYLCQPVVYA